MTNQIIRIKIESFRFEYLEQMKHILISFFNKHKFIKKTILFYLPTIKKVFCILRAPIVHKDTREHFIIKRFRTVIDIHLFELVEPKKIIEEISFLNHNFGSICKITLLKKF
uniref:30S ribosomal protein S10 n=1 Tax=Nitzschia alba TaxID=2858 RepID=A0A5C0F465_NITAL|nr:30S ribosomal protein S10 [Nitzschia alba]QEI59608.1 30S ribosomal protein S10 [Nitzschia alba]